MGLVQLVSARRPRIQMRWDRVYVLTLVVCFWIAAAEITSFSGLERFRGQLDISVFQPHPARGYRMLRATAGTIEN